MDISLPSENLTGVREKSTTTLFYQLIYKIRLAHAMHVGYTITHKLVFQCSLLLRGRRHGNRGALEVGPESAFAGM